MHLVYTVDEVMRPGTGRVLIAGRLFDFHMLDMIELGIEKYSSLSDIKVMVSDWYMCIYRFTAFSDAVSQDAAERPGWLLYLVSKLWFVWKTQRGSDRKYSNTFDFLTWNLEAEQKRASSFLCNTVNQCVCK